MKKETTKLLQELCQEMNIKMEILSYDIIKTKNNKLYVLEINSGVSVSIFSRVVEHGKELTKEIYKKALIEIFN